MDNDANPSINSAHPTFISSPSEIQLFVRDHDTLGAPSSRLLSQYLSQETAARLLNRRNPPSLAVLEGEISTAGAIIEALQVLIELKGRLRNRYIPISTLPTEIICGIFGLIAYEPLESGYTVPLACHPPLILSQVCSQWRSIVHDLPRLWGVLYCRVSSPAQSRHEASMIHKWLGRTKGHPLFIRLDFEDEGAWVDRYAPRDLVEVLVSFSASWQEIQLVLPISWFRPLRSLGHLGSLKSLDLRPVAHYYSNRRLKGFNNAPRLSTLRYSAMHLRTLQIPFTQLTDATIDRISVDEMLKFVSKCPSLVRFHFIDPYAGEGSVPIPVVPYTHLLLEELRITIEATHPAIIPAHIFTDLLVAPRVKLISWTLPQDISYDPLTPTASFVERSCCRLEVLEIFGPQLHEDDIADFLLDVPHEVQVINW